MNYSIKLENGDYILRDGGIILSKHTTMDEAKTELETWKYRDNLSSEIEDFKDKVLADYRHYLDEDEILSMIRDS